MGSFRAAVQDRLILPATALLTREVEAAARALGRSIAAPIAVRLVLDTGSKRSSMVPSVLDRLNPPPAGRANVETVLASAAIELFWVRLEFPDSSLAAVPLVAVARLPMPASLREYQGVVGRDLLSRWESFLYEGRRAGSPSAIHRADCSAGSNGDEAQSKTARQSERVGAWPPAGVFGSRDRAPYRLARFSSTSVRMRSPSRATSNGFLNASLKP